MHREIEKLQSTLSKNAYPETFVDRIIHKFMYHKFTEHPPVHTVARKKVQIFLPYLGNTSHNLRMRLKWLFRKLHTCELKVIFTTSYRLGNMFRFKDRLPETLKSKLVYSFKCRSCNASYIGQTSRHHKVRVSEHLGLSPRTGKKLQPSLINASKIKEHILCNLHEVNDDDFKILSTGGLSHVLEIKESIMLKKFKPTLNDNVTSKELFLF